MAMDFKLIEKYKNLGIADTIDHDEFKNISVVYHSTAIEGSTIFRDFMAKEYTGLLKDEIRKFEEIEKPKKGKGFTLLF